VSVLVLVLGLARDRVDGLDPAPEDDLAKPFDIDELLARIRTPLRRHVTSPTRCPSRADC
jgi:two-component system response regulator QseB